MCSEEHVSSVFVNLQLVYPDNKNCPAKRRRRRKLPKLHVRSYRLYNDIKRSTINWCVIAASMHKELITIQLYTSKWLSFYLYKPMWLAYIIDSVKLSSLNLCLYQIQQDNASLLGQHRLKTLLYNFPCLHKYKDNFKDVFRAGSVV